MKRPVVSATVAVFLCVGLACALRATAQAQRQREAARMLVGHVMDGRDQPVEKAIVYLKNTRNLNVRSYITEADGSYHFPALAPNVDFEVRAEFQGASSDTKTISAFDDRKLVNITLRIHRR